MRAIIFRESEHGKLNIEDEPLSGRPVFFCWWEASTWGLTNWFNATVESGRHTSSLIWAYPMNELGTSNNWATEKICSSWEANKLTEHDIRKSKEWCGQLLIRNREERVGLLFNIVIRDERRLNHYDHKKKGKVRIIGIAKYRILALWFVGIQEMQNWTLYKTILLTVLLESKHLYVTEHLQAGMTVTSA